MAGGPLMYLDVLYTILILGGSTPDVTIIPSTPQTIQECEAEKAMLDADAPTLVDPVTGRPVIMRFHKCVNINVEGEIERLERALTRNQ